MSFTSGRMLLLGLRWSGPPSARTCERTGQFLEEITALENRGLPIPLHWCLTPGLHLEKPDGSAARLFAAIRERVRDGGDRVLSPGYAGAVHPLLTDPELGDELRWSRENLWGSGVRDRFDSDQPALLPVYPDLIRAATGGIYHSHGFSAIGVDGTGIPPRRRRFLYSLGAGSTAALQVFTFLPLPFDLLGREPRELRAALHGYGAMPLFLLIDVDGGEPGGGSPEPSALRTTLEQLLVRFPRRLATLSAALQRAGSPPAAVPPYPAIGLPVPPFAPDPVQRGVWNKARRTRSTRAEGPARRTLLASPPSAEGPPESPADLPARRRPRRADHRSVTASMTGTAVLSGSAFEVLFRNGQFAGLLHSGLRDAARRFLHGTLAASYLKVSGRRYPFQPQSCISFEGPDGLGVSTVLTLEAAGEIQPGSINVDYTFTDGRPELRLDLAIQYPVLPPGSSLEESVPLEIPLFRIGREEPVAVEAEQADGSVYRRTHYGQEDYGVLSGRRFILRQDGRRLILDWPEKPTDGQHLLQLRTRRTGRSRDLVGNPFGSYFPTSAARTSGRRDEFSLLLSLESRSS